MGTGFRWQKHFTIGLFIIGTILLAMSTFNFTYKIPNIDREIQNNETQKSTIRENYLRYENLRTTTTIMENQWHLLNETNPNSPILTKIHREMRQDMIEAMTYYYLVRKGEFLDKATFEKWNSLTVNQLTDEYIKLGYKSGDTTTYAPAYTSSVASLNELKKEKDDTLFWSTLFQISGLFLYQLAIISDLLWRKD